MSDDERAAVLGDAERLRRDVASLAGALRVAIERAQVTIVAPRDRAMGRAPDVRRTSR
jgi:hypothetical protein